MKAWEELLILLEKQLGEETIAKWLRPIKVLKFDAVNLYLEAAPFQRNWFEEHIRHRIIGLFRNNNHRPIRIHWETSAKKKFPERFQEPRHFGDRLEESYRIDNFFPFQRMALEMAREVISPEPSFIPSMTNTPNCLRYNPLFFFGPTGSGKTHLLMGIAAELLKQGKRVLYLQAETFTGHVIQAIRQGEGMQNLRQTTRNVDVLILDDVQAFSRKSATQEEFFHTFNALHTAGKQIILSASQAPAKLEEIEQRLISRFEWGISIPLLPLNQTQIKQILEEKIKPLKIFNSAVLIDFLMSRFRSTAKAPFEALYTLTLRNPKQIDLTQLEKTLADLLIREQKFTLTPEKIIKKTAFYFGVKPEDLLGKSQQRSNVEPRKVALYFCRTLLHLPYQTIGKIFNRDHSTVMTSVAQVKEGLAQRKVPFEEAVEHISKSLRQT